MATAEPAYEVEIRFSVPTPEQAYELLPFLKASLGPETTWATAIYNREIYGAGRLLRVGRVPAEGDSQRYYLGYKETDEGTFANIRQEWGEEITDGVTASAILTKLGIDEAFPSAKIVMQRLQDAGHKSFMDFRGADRLGYYPALDLQTKLMRCTTILGDQVMVELEMAATSSQDALAAERKLQQIAEEYGIVDRLIREEPPTLLYQVTFEGRIAGDG